MCGIAGTYNSNGGEVSLELVETIGSMMMHRGPDNFSFLGLNNIAVSHNRLSLLDLSAAANQPFKNDDYTLVYNGEIYNFKEIRERLKNEHNLKFETTSDTEVLFYSLIYDGIDECLKHIKGMFAFAFYDNKKDELWLGRDRLGIKPLYYHRKNGSFYWSSEVKALARSLDIKLDPIKTLFAINGIAEKSSDYTMFEGIFPVKPGTYLKVSSKSSEPELFYYYKPIDDFEPEIYKELDQRSSGEVVSQFEKLFVGSIESMLVSDAPLGTFVSGGIDSSLISAIANKFYPELKLFSANVIGPNSEFEDAKALAKHIDSELFDYKFEPEMLLTNWAEVTYFYECPIVVHANAIPFAKIARLAREMNVKAVLTGEGADELFLGYPRLLTKRFDKFAAFPVNALKSLYGLVPGLKSYLFPNGKATSLDFVNQMVQGFESTRVSEENSEKFDFLSQKQRREQYLTLKMVGDHLTTLLHRNDRMGMMASIEARFPFLQEDLVKFAINLPVKYKIGNSLRFHNYKHPFLIDKWMVREIAKKYLPKSIVNKKKKGFPMTGLKSVRVKDEFFKNGWISNNLALTNEMLNFLVEKEDPYFVGKLASVEIFARIFGNGESIEQVTEHILKNAHMREE
jgi:asparagine synthase (glutamine-hydrolysing)